MDKGLQAGLMPAANANPALTDDTVSRNKGSDLQADAVAMRRLGGFHHCGEDRFTCDASDWEHSIYSSACHCQFRQAAVFIL